MIAKLNNDLIATVAGDITVYNYNSETREYFSSSVEFVPIGVGIPAHSCIDAPDGRKQGYAICRSQDLSAWEYIADHRGKTVYNIETGSAQVITALGDYPTNTTPEAPTTSFDKWNGKRWVIDAQAQHQYEQEQAESKKKYLLSTATEKIDIWQDAVDLGMAIDVEKSALAAWRKYRVLLNRIDCSIAPDIEWPEQPK
ncbi:tail assembly protein [Xenorhabdus mauleonii]|uniref:Tail assembly protein n=1 Tax=Xenorhabdus mauleonii TaxID=351675 RepID=A0A1I3YTM1_9GAMM|nr:tail fiber assembly protein [Xenorhabdus mauleonii]PHM33347.1 tail assembly protein [Xenorhabdus mauleonii]SFK35178.1 virus tail fibre assembly protein, lambda gpK [Xenorhabdus mauleonii]